MKNSYKLEEFIYRKIEETINTYVVAFHSNKKIKCLGTLRVDKNIQKLYNLEDDETYDIYLKLKTSISDCCTRLILTKITSKHY